MISLPQQDVGEKQQKRKKKEGKRDNKKNNRIIISIEKKTKRETLIIECCDLGHNLEWLVHPPLFPPPFLLFFLPPHPDPAHFYSVLAIHTPSDIMCHVIVTCRSMLWTLLSIAAAFSELIAFLSTDWLVGFPRVPDSALEASSEAYRPTLGLFGRCVFVGRVMCGPYALTFNEIASGFWKAAAIFLATGILLLSAVAFTSIFTICFQSIMRKSIFNVCGLLQGIAGTQTNTCSHIYSCTHAATRAATLTLSRHCVHFVHLED